MPKADATGLAPKESADYNPPAHHWFVRGRVWLLRLAAFNFQALHNPPACACQNQVHFFGEVSGAEALGLKREDRPAAFAGRSESQSYWARQRVGIPLLPTQGEYPIPLACPVYTPAR
jgi:hypothetical protein